VFDPKRRYLVIQPVGGLGNRMAALVSAHELAIKEDRELWVHWPIQGGKPKDRFPTSLEDIYRVTGIRQISTGVWRNALKAPGVFHLSLKNSHLALAPDISHDVIVCPLHGRIQGREETDRPAWCRVFWDNYFLQPPLQKAVSEFRSYYSVGEKTIGLQIRIHGHRLAREWKPEKQFRRWLQLSISHYSSHNFFVSCDDREITAGLRKEFGDCIVSQDKDSELNTDLALKQSAMDFHLLAACKRIYSSRCSGMSYFACLIRNEQRKYPG